MTVLPIIRGDTPDLRRRVTPVSDFSHDLRQLVDNLVETMQMSHFASLSAIQCGIPSDIFVTQIEGQVRIWVNTRIIEMGESFQGGESCASFPDLILETERPQQLCVRTWTVDGVEEERGVQGIEARLVSHEIDHQQGTLMLDHLSEEDLFTQMLGMSAMEDDDDMQDEEEDVLGQDDDDVSQILDFIAESTWKLVLAAELLEDFSWNESERVALNKLKSLVSELTTVADEWEQILD